MRKIYINRRPVEGPWGGGNVFVKSMYEFFPRNGYKIIDNPIKEQPDIIFLQSPYPDSILNFSINDAVNIKQKNKTTKIYLRVNDCDARKGTEGVDDIWLETSKFVDKTFFVSNWMKNYPKIEMTLIKGNHDILDQGTYLNSNLSMTESWHEPPFYFTHEKETSGLYNISGHVHPAVRLKGRAKQGLTIPCFYFSENFGMIPAFGEFTGTFKIKPLKGDRIYGVTKEEVIALMT